MYHFSFSFAFKELRHKVTLRKCNNAKFGQEMESGRPVR